jgi:hypothetical protein
MYLQRVFPKMMRIGLDHNDDSGKAIINMPRPPPSVKVTIMLRIRPN